MDTYLTDPWIWLACIAAVAVIGIGKGGFAGIAMLAAPLLALVLPAKAAIGILLPVLIVQDVVSVWSFRTEWDKWIIAWMLPGGMIGVGLGWWFAANLDAAALTVAIGSITAIFAAYRLWRERGNRILAASRSPGWVGALFGIGAGFTSQVAHAGAPPFQMWVMPRKLPHTIYVGTNAVLFAAINWLKVPAYLSLGALDKKALVSAAVLMPIAIGCTLLSLRLIRRLRPERFYRLIYWIMLALGLFLILRDLLPALSE